MNLFSGNELRQWTATLMRAHGLLDTHADMVAEALVDADLRGIDTHGIAQLPSYVALLQRGVTRAEPDIRIDARGVILAVDADRGLGQVVATIATDAAIALARDTGMAAAAIHESGHLGALGYFARRAAQAGMLALVMQNGPPLMALPGAKRRAIGNNPLAFAAPMPGRPPIVFDMSASQAAYGKVLAAAASGETLPEGWALDAEGQPTQDAKAAAAGMLVPAAGAKGIGLAMMVECLAGSLSGTRPVWGGGLFGGFVLVIRTSAAVDAQAFTADLQDWLAHYAASGPGNRYPGERAQALFEDQSRTGVPLGGALVGKLGEIGARAGVPFISALEGDGA